MIYFLFREEINMYFHYMKREAEGKYLPVDPKLIIGEEEEYDAILVFQKMVTQC
jgi:hypothetical protein